MEFMPRDFRINIRIGGQEAERFGVIYDRVMRETKNQAQMTTIIMELLGLRPPYLTTDEDKRFLAHGDSAPILSQGEMRKRGRPRKVPPLSQTG